MFANIQLFEILLMIIVFLLMLILLCFGELFTEIKQMKVFLKEQLRTKFLD